MSNLSDFLGGSKPKLITVLTSSTGTYVPTVDMARCFIRVQGGGGSGCASLAAGGGGAMVAAWRRIPIAGMAYTVGAGGATNSGTTALNGSLSRFDSITAQRGLGGAYINSTNNSGGFGGKTMGTSNSSTDGSVAGGAGGYGTFNGSAYGWPISSVTSGGTQITIQEDNNGNGICATGYGGGGDSFFGKGGNGNVTVGLPGTGYGSGGGAGGTSGGAGAGGCIEIWDYGV